jgi:hypothetical protein
VLKLESLRTRFPKRDVSELAAKSSLTREKKCLGVPPFSAEFEGAEIFVPESFWHFWLRFHPDAELIQIWQADVAIMHALDEMLPKRGWEAGPRLNLRHSFSEDEAPHLIPKLFYLFRIGGGAKAFR